MKYEVGKWYGSDTATFRYKVINKYNFFQSWFFYYSRYKFLQASNPMRTTVIDVLKYQNPYELSKEESKIMDKAVENMYKLDKKHKLKLRKEIVDITKV